MKKIKLFIFIIAAFHSFLGVAMNNLSPVRFGFCAGFAHSQTPDNHARVYTAGDCLVSFSEKAYGQFSLFEEDKMMTALWGLKRLYVNNDSQARAFSYAKVGDIIASEEINASLPSKSPDSTLIEFPISEHVQFIIMGSSSLWRVVDEATAGKIVRRALMLGSPKKAAEILIKHATDQGVSEPMAAIVILNIDYQIFDYQRAAAAALQSINQDIKN